MKIFRPWLVLIVLLPISPRLLAEMINGDAIGNDPKLVKLCIDRTNMGKAVPFEIESRYVAQVRALHPDATFVALERQEVECYAGGRDGKFGPMVYGGVIGFWKIIYQGPKRYEPGMGTRLGKEAALKACVGPADEKFHQQNFDHREVQSVYEMLPGSITAYNEGLYAGPAAVPYDVEVVISSFYKTSGPDMSTLTYRCLLSPMLELKNIELRKKKPF